MEKFMFLFRGGENHAHNAKDSQAAMDNMQEWGKWMQDMMQFFLGVYLLGVPHRK